MSMKTVKLAATIGNREGTFSFDYSMDMEIPVNAHASMEGLLQKGFGEILRDKFSTFKIAKDGDKPERDATPEEKDAHTRSKLEELVKGTYSFGGRTGGKILSDEDYALKEALTTLKVKFKKGESVEQCILRVVGEVPEGSDPFDEETLEKRKNGLIEKLHKMETYKLALKSRKEKAKVEEGIDSLIDSL